MNLRTIRRRLRRGRPAPLESTLTRDGLTFVYPAGDRLGGRLAGAGVRREMTLLAAVTAAYGCSGTLLDVGANIGTTTVPALALHGFERAVCVEPHPLNARLLRANLALNGVAGRAVVIEAAATDRSGAARLRVSRSNSGGHSLGKGGELEVETITIDSLGVEPSLLWLDVQGAEGEALAGATATLRTRPIVVLELSKRANLAAVASALAGYSLSDLRSGRVVESLSELASALAGRHTDLLALPRP